MRTNMDKTGPSDLYRSITEPEGWRERDKARDLKWCMNMAAHEAAAGDPPMSAGGDLWMTVQEAERLAALWCAGQPLDELPQWRTAMQVLARELADTRAALKKANDHAERFEREWYLRGDALETALAAKNEAESRELKAAQEADELRASLRELVALADMRARLEKLHEMGHGTDWDSYHKRNPAAWALARSLALGHNAELTGARRGSGPTPS